MRVRTAVATALMVLLLPAPAAAAPVAADLHLPGTAWWVEPATGRTVVAADATVGARDLRRLAGAGVRIVREPGKRRLHLAGGDSVQPTGSTSRCTLGFNARDAGSAHHFLAAAHCLGGVGTSVSAGPVLLGDVTAVDAARDIAVVRYRNPAIAKPSAVSLPGGALHMITAFGPPVVGRRIQRVGRTTGLRAGTITAINVTVNFPEGTLTGLARTTACAEPGDSGGPVFSGGVGLGLVSGGSGSCATGGISYFTPIHRTAAAFGLTAY
ncbi:S1 family peptidase [Actinoplanes sp. NPDC049599]|uniref:S1 family peptidase n=1 Tax=Actinoplanes sp. NPDC049599 TaxID=3363903 RepID=UPI0037B56F9D